MKKIFVIILLFWFSISAHAQYQMPSIKKTSITIQGFIPQNWFVSDSSFGDLNNDDK